MKSARLLLITAVLALSACGGKDTPPAPTESSTEAAGPEAKPGIAISGGALVLPAVAGNPAAAYFVLSNRSPKAVSVAGVFIEGAAKAEMHETKGGSMGELKTLALQPGELAVFEPGGKHVMAFDLATTLAAGGTTEMTVTFADGDKISAPLAIKGVGQSAASAPADEMDGMDHGDMH